MSPALNHVDILVLVALARLGNTAYGVPIRDEIVRVTRRDVSMAAVYAALERIQHLGLAIARQSDPLPERGGRSRRLFGLTEPGLRALRNERELSARLWRDLDLGAEADAR